jgi:omega-amidase
MPDLNVTLVQADLAWEDAEANRGAFARRLEALPRGTDLVVLPEMFTTGFSMQAERLAETMQGPTVAWMQAAARRTGATLAGSAIIRTGAGLFNRLLWVPPEGPLRHYDKRHLFRMGGEHRVYQPGGRLLSVQLKGWRVRPLICYDLRFPIWCRNLGPGYDLLLVIANWPSVRREHWKTLLIARAIENQAWVVAVNRVGRDGHGLDYSGDSMVVDPFGGVRYQRAADEAMASVRLSQAELENGRAQFAAWKDADHTLAAPLETLGDEG